jgi:hypothetical protein
MRRPDPRRQNKLVSAKNLVDVQRGSYIADRPRENALSLSIPAVEAESRIGQVDIVVVETQSAQPPAP